MGFKHSFILIFIASGILLQSDYLLAFAISKDINQNQVNYDLRMKPDCTLGDFEKPKIYWQLGTGDSGHRENLNLVEQAIYGFEIEDRQKNEILGQVKALKKTKLNLKIKMVSRATDSGCRVDSILEGQSLSAPLVIQQIRLQKFKGSTPQEVLISGKDQGDQSQKKYIFQLH